GDFMAKENSILTTVLVSLVVAVIASLATVSLTGNAILSGSNSTGPSTFSGTNWLQAVFQGTVNAGGIGLKAVNGQQYELQSVQDGNFIIYDRNRGQYRMVISPAGNVGIGKTNPQNKLDVAGNVNVNGNLYSQGMIRAYSLNSSYITASSIGLSGPYTLRATLDYNGLGVFKNVNLNSTSNTTTRIISTQISPGKILITDPNGIVWYCGPSTSGVWTCTKF
ncbi:MAG: hypothetical protein AABX48_01375, partial [Nanoarchaeota archaeon]